MNARQVFRFREQQGEATVEMVIWALPQATAEKLLMDFRADCERLAGWKWE